MYVWSCLTPSIWTNQQNWQTEMWFHSNTARAVYHRLALQLDIWAIKGNSSIIITTISKFSP